ncbi:unnamed protein product [Mytilus coruscus]|uniref:Uncharacterized protein n=1 Tax=Mytilus coruscus TaxID=42192 RepID=A0A6J8E6I9_MYTCO|nr:unnamed protein product [Mytilus coruscus]
MGLPYLQRRGLLEANIEDYIFKCMYPEIQENEIYLILTQTLRLKHPERVSYSKRSKHSQRHHHIRKRHISSTEDSYTEESYDSVITSGFTSSSLISDKSDNRIPEIISYSSNTLAKQAGELLLDLHKYKSEPKVSNIMNLLGIIVDGTKVYFTMLERSESHHEKLDKNIQLNGSDRATVYYAKPLDILVQRDRDIVIENLVRLHNI